MGTRAQRRHPKRQGWDSWILPIALVVAILGILGFVFSQRDNILDWLDVWPSDQQLQQITWDGTTQSLSKMCIRGCGPNFTFAIAKGQKWPAYGKNNGGCRNFWLPQGTSMLFFGQGREPVSVFYGPRKVRGVCGGIFASADFGSFFEYMRDNPGRLGPDTVVPETLLQ